MGMIRYTVDPKETVALRFDDPDFLDALASAEGDFYDQLERLLGGVPAEADLSGFVADGVVLHARASVSGREDGRLGNDSQQDDARKGIKVDVPRATESKWGLWVPSVEDAAGGVPAGLSDRNRAVRQETFGALPAPVQDAFVARLRVHERDARRDALRDPSKTHSPATGKGYRPTLASADGPSADAHPTDLG